MFWIIGFALLTLVCLIGCFKGGLYRGEEWSVGFWVSAIIFAIIALVMISTGVNTYPNMRAQREELISLQSTITLIESGHYDEVESGMLVGGSLDNIHQSTLYTEYLKEYAYKKARFNKYLTEIQIKKERSIFGWLSFYFFVSLEVKEIEKF